MPTERNKSIIVACQCGKRFRAKSEHAGKRAKCPGCGANLKILPLEPSKDKSTADSAEGQNEVRRDGVTEAHRPDIQASHSAVEPAYREYRLQAKSNATGGRVETIIQAPNDDTAIAKAASQTGRTIESLTLYCPMCGHDTIYKFDEGALPYAQSISIFLTFLIALALMMVVGAPLDWLGIDAPSGGMLGVCVIAFFGAGYLLASIITSAMLNRTVKWTCQSCGHTRPHVRLVPDTSREHPPLAETSPPGSIPFACWTCGGSLTSTRDPIGECEICPQCETPNLVPSPLGLEELGDPTVCYFCKNNPPDDESACQCHARLELREPKMRCRKCNAEWEEPVHAPGLEGGTGTHECSPECPKCHRQVAVPIELPVNPIGACYGGFRSLGILWDSDTGMRTLVLTGSIIVPRCRKCKSIHARVAMIMTATLITVGILAIPATLYVFDMQPSKHLGDSIFVSLVGVVVAELLIGIPIWFMVQRTIGRRTQEEGAKTDYPAIKLLRDKGWSM